MIENKACRKCGDALTDENWYPSYQKYGNYICNKCNNIAGQAWKKANPEKTQAGSIRYIRTRGAQPFNENKECAQYLGVHVTERVLSHVFKDVVVMPMHNPGYDFICNRGKMVDAKSSCLHKNGAWSFNIKHNTTANYFLCLAFNNREDLTPMHAWLLPSNKVSHLSSAVIYQSTIHKWDTYRLDLSKISACCDNIGV